MSKFYKLVLLLLLASCATTTKHFVMKGEMVFDGAVYKDQSWNDSLVFKKVTWFREFTTMYELAYVKLDRKSPYFQWLSLKEKAEFRKHNNCYVLLAYQESSDKINHHMLVEEFSKYNYEKIQLLSFKKFLMTHPKAGEYSLKRYNVIGVCTDEMPKNISISFPNFKTVNL